MKIHIISIGNKLPDWVNTGVEEYLKRFTPMVDFSLSLQEIPAQKRGKNAPIAKIVAAESQALIDAVPKGFIPVALDVGGQRLSSEKLAQKLQRFHDNGEHIAILIGGPEGFNLTLRQFARQRWSLSDLTLPHPIVRVVLAETLYRSVSILHHHPYHRSGQRH
ncbi:MAG: 23S rRNA (pseudouridine(1915)-N(3))-methyltransferase RlmH [Gammaproteobacteria bacterium]|nr:MAG: 23S rRNA (pseudouridine(1915)-N(3))-methyltransferase RlmH [Gammaproteobacteria bacterium]